MITLTLTDDEALKFMAQLGAQVGGILGRNQKDPTTHQPNEHRTKSQMVRDMIDTFPTGYEFRNVEIQIKAGVDVSSVSSALADMAEEKTVKSPRRGTWVKL